MTKTRAYEDLADIYPLWRSMLLKEKHDNEHAKKEINFLLSLLKKQKSIKSVIDLGGGIGIHSIPLSKQDYDVTLFDQSIKALDIAQKKYPNLKTIEGGFETINLSQKFDATICMWSTINYLTSEKSRRAFYKWIKEHTRQIVIFDQANFYKYSSRVHKVYQGEDQKNRLKITRDWVLSKNNIRKTRYAYEIINKTTGIKKYISDGEVQQFLTIQQLEKYMGNGWKLDQVFGDYDNKKYSKKISERIITIFTRSN